MSRPVEIVFVSPETRKSHRHLPYALLYLSSFCEAKGVSTRIIDIKDSFSKTSPLQGFKTLPYLDCVLEVIRAERPGLICLTCYTAEYHSVMRTAGCIRSAVNIPIVIGGVHPTLMPQDFFVRGQPGRFSDQRRRGNSASSFMDRAAEFFSGVSGGYSGVGVFQCTAKQND